MRVYLILSLLAAAAYAEKKINLEDIERDNLKAESKTNVESFQTDETKYNVKPNVNQQQYSAYQVPSQYNTLGGHSDVHLPPPQQIQDAKYSLLPEQYIRPNQYAVHETQYQQPGQILPQQSIPPAQYYGGYQQQAGPAKGVLTSFESQKLSYQPEVVVGNQIQGVQQKAVTEKYTKAVDKGPVYFGIPMTQLLSQLLSYYPHLDVNSAALKDAGYSQPSLQQLAGDATQQISIPVYTPIYNQKQLTSPVKTSYQYSTVPATYTTKVTKGPTHALPLAPKKLNSAPVLPTIPLYVQPQQTLAQGKKFLYTQAYVAPSQPRYQLIYTQPGVIYNDHAAAYSDFYARVPTYVQDNSLHGQVSQYQTQQQLYVAPSVGHEASREILREQISQDLLQSHVKAPEEPKTHFVPPQLPAQDFKSGVTQLEPVSYEDEEPLLKDYSLSAEPKSLLDTYVPSKIIAAQDGARYRERPIKLEGGFLPSKVNFALKKRKPE